jgi:hypothetical protein
MAVLTTSAPVYFLIGEASMTDSDLWFVGDRAKSFAVMLLTRLPGISVEYRTGDEDIDLLVTMDGHGLSGRFFGIEIKGTQRLGALVNSNGLLKKQFGKQLIERARKYRFPIALMVVDILADKAVFGWLLEPDANSHSLRAPENVHTSPVTTHFLHLAAQQVEGWYAAQP